MADRTELPGEYSSPSVATLDAALTSADGSYYTAARLLNMNYNDKVYADKLRLAGGALPPVASKSFVNPWGLQASIPSKPATTSATAGNGTTPGVFLPDGCALPTNLANLQSVAPTAVPSSAWTTGQRVVMADGNFANWTGAAWAAGAHA